MGSTQFEVVDEVDEVSEESTPDEGGTDDAPKPPAKMPEASGDELPEWAVVPAGLKVPRGRQVIFLRFPGAMTHANWKGDRQCVVWTLSDTDEKVAHKRCAGDSNRVSAELTKQMIRAIDGSVADWGAAKGTAGSIDEFWREIGPKGRQLLMRVYVQTHHPDEAEVRDFFERCIAVRTAS